MLKGYKRTEYVVAMVCERFTPTYRTAYEKDGKYYVQWKNKIERVSEDRLVPKKNIKK
jgi:hypothetical protein